MSSPKMIKIMIVRNCRGIKIKLSTIKRKIPTDKFMTLIRQLTKKIWKEDPEFFCWNGNQRLFCGF